MEPSGMPPATPRRTSSMRARASRVEVETFSRGSEATGVLFPNGSPQVGTAAEGLFSYYVAHIGLLSCHDAPRNLATKT